MNPRVVARRVRDRLRPPAVSDWRRLEAAGQVSAGVGTYHLDGLRIHAWEGVDGQWLSGKLWIGNYCSLAASEFLLGGNHHPEWVSHYPFFSHVGPPDEFGKDMRPSGDIVLGNDVWVGMGAMILPGVTIGDGALVAARAVVTKDVRPYAVVVGNPAREVRRRFDDPTVERLLEMAWWEWPEAEIAARWRELSRSP